LASCPLVVEHSMPRGFAKVKQDSTQASCKCLSNCYAAI